MADLICYLDGFIGRLEKAEGLYTFLVVVDSLAKYSYFVGISHHPFIANDLAAMFHVHVFFSSIVPERPDFFWEIMEQAVSDGRYPIGVHYCLPLTN
jgi:hypothetical protein